MVDHLSRDVLGRFAGRTLSAREMLRIDKHLGECAECRTTLSSAVQSRRAAERVVFAVTDAVQHLSYGQLEAYVDERLTADGRAKVDLHIAGCARCTRELDDLQSCARGLASPIVARTNAPSAAAHPVSRGFLAAVKDWFGGMPGLRAATAVLVAAVAIALVMQGGGPGHPTTAIDFVLSRDAINPDSVPPDRASFDQTAFAVVAAASSEFADAYRAADFAKVAAQLRAGADRGDREAQAALALMYIAGEGVGRDIAEAERLLRSAAAQKLASAAHNLGVVYSRQLLGGKDDAEAERWFEEAAKLRDR